MRAFEAEHVPGIAVVSLRVADGVVDDGVAVDSSWVAVYCSTPSAAAAAEHTCRDLSLALLEHGAAFVLCQPLVLAGLLLEKKTRPKKMIPLCLSSYCLWLLCLFEPVEVEEEAECV